MPFSIQRTNVRLTGNISIVVDEHDKKYLETIDSSLELSRSVYKGLAYNDDLPYAANLRTLTGKLAEKRSLYSVPDESMLTASHNLSNQYHQLYDYGCVSSTSKIVKSSFRFFAPMYISKSDVETGDMPDAFLIYRLPANNTGASIDDNLNFIDTLKNNATLIKAFDTKFLTSMLRDMHDSKLRVRFDHGIVTEGIDANLGIYTRKDEAGMNTLLANERTITEFENHITNSFQRNEMIFSNIMNLTFAFNDEPMLDFVRYIGVYVKYNDIDTETAQDMSILPTLQLIDTAAGIVQYTDRPLTTYDNVLTSATGLAFGAERAPQISLKINFSPRIGEHLKIMYNGNTEIDIEMNSVTLGNTVSETRTKLIIAINAAAKHAEHITVTAFNQDDNIIIRSNSAHPRYEQIYAVLPKTIIANGIKYPSGHQTSFFGSSVNTIILDNYFNADTVSKIQYFNDSGESVVSNIIRISEYDGNFLYQLDAPTNRQNNIDTVWLIEERTEQTIICSVLDHKTIDFDHGKNYYDDVLDFNPPEYYTYLQSIINDDSYRGRADELYDHVHPGEPATEAERIEYKDQINNMLNKYFSNIILDREYLIKNINQITYEATTVPNEYQRLNEDSQDALMQSNKLYSFVNKWVLPNGTDVYQNQVRLNASLPFRFDGFSPSIVSIDRDIRFHTHGWPVIADGPNPYYAVDEKHITKCLSYSTNPITVDMLLDTDVDAYENLEYTTEVRTHAAYQIIQYDVDYSTCRVFYRGLMLEFSDQTLDGYRFSVLLKSDAPTANDNLETQFIRNDVFKTMTLYCRFYIPDPVLTTLEIPGAQYYLDRSLLYFSNEIYATGDDSVDFGTSPISLTLYNNTEQKPYLGTVRTLDWYFYDAEGDSHIYVKRGDQARFKSFISDVLAINEDFTMQFTDTLDTSDPLYGMEITFVNIHEVKEDYFWCSDIIIKYVETDNSGTPGVPEDDAVTSIIERNVLDEYIADGPNDGTTIFDTDNAMYVTRAIAYENCTYEKTVRAKTNVARYKDISTASIVDRLNSADISTTRTYVDNGEILTDNEYQTCRVHSPLNTSIVIKLTQDASGKLTELQNKYVYPILRYNGSYIPMFTDVCVWSAHNGFQSVVFQSTQPENRYRLNVGNVSPANNMHANYYTEAYTRDRQYNKFYHIVTAAANRSIETFDTQWVANPAEFKSFVSLVLSSPQELIIEAVVQLQTNNITKLDIVDILYDTVKTYCRINEFTLSDIEKLQILKLYTDVTANTLVNYDFDKIITKQFILHTIMNIYSVDTVKNGNSQRLSFYNNEHTIFVTDESISNTDTLLITFTRN